MLWERLMLTRKGMKWELTLVPNMNYNGLATGRARGGAPMARIAVYKSCWDSGCYDVDVLAAFDNAIKDGVHILSVSLGPQSPQGDYFNDAVSIGSFHAARHGVMVVASVGNEGFPGSATNLAPWMITVGASSTDRDFTSDIILGDGTKYKGESLSLFKMSTFSKIISASEANAGYFTPYQSSYCLDSSLNSTKTRGKVLVCRHTGSPSDSKLEKSKVVKEVGGIGMILIDDADKDMAIPFVIPAAIVGTQTGERILSYINHTRKPTARIFQVKTVIGSEPAPRITSFSSKGPNSLTPDILKPDVTAPGLNILAAWSPAAIKKLNFNIISGTSMACPHVTGIAALIKAVHPTWSPSAIKSAIMTTVGGIAGGLTMAVLAIGFLWFCMSWCKKFSNKGSETASSDPSTLVEWNRGAGSTLARGHPLSGPQGARRFTLEELEQATNQFLIQLSMEL